MTTSRKRARTGSRRRRRNTRARQQVAGKSNPLFWIAVSALLATALLAPAYVGAASCEKDGTTVNCTDVPAGGIAYASGVTEINVADGDEGVAVVDPGKAGIALYLYGSTGNSDVNTDFATIPYDHDNDATTDDEDVVAEMGAPVMLDGEYIIDNGGDPQTFTIGTDVYTGEELSELLADSVVGSGGAVTGFLTINNSAPLSTTDALGVGAASQGGYGGNGGCWTILLIYTHCSDGSNGGSAGSVAINNHAEITTNGSAEGAHGVLAVSQGGHGGKGGGFIGLFTNAGEGGDGGAGGNVSVILGPDSDITTHGPRSHGVYALSTGGHGGAAGYAPGAFAWGDSGGNGGDAGEVMVDNDGSIMTYGWNSHGIYARSVGAGAGQGSDASGLYAVGGNGGGESDGNTVDIYNSGSIETANDDSFGVLAQSIGGGGGDGGGAGGWFTVGGRGGSGGNGGAVSVTDSGSVQTGGDRSTAIFAQSIGGGGGNGGDAISIGAPVTVAIGGTGGPGGDGANVEVTADGSDIDTGGIDSHGIQAQSIGGGGGNGGIAVSGSIPGSGFQVAVSIGGSGGEGGDAGELVEVSTTPTTTIDTAEIRSYGIIAQSIGGGGGNGGAAIAAAGGPGLSVAVGIGGVGGEGGAGGGVLVDNEGAITTESDLSVGIAAQSIGGGGGNGGFSGTLAIGAASASVSVGGSGGWGGAAGQVDVNNYGMVTTGGDNAIGIFAQSLGGGGGNGGSALSGSVGLLSVATAVGGGGGAGNDGGIVNVLNEGLITTDGANSTGVFAQSIGGGGGNGGSATSASIAGGAAIGVAVGGSGAAGGIGGNVFVDNLGSIDTEGVNSDGVFAQSIGGSGGTGGGAATFTLAFPVEIEDIEIPAIALGVAVGGQGGGGGMAGIVDIDNSGTIDTLGFMANGVFAQSVGGSGGRGGNATNIQIAFDALFSGTVSVGGPGGAGGIGNSVFVDNAGVIHTRGDYANGVFAQSVGGGGGNGGDATTVAISLTPPPTAPTDFIPTPSMSFDLAIGGDGGTGGIGGAVDVSNTGTITTEGHFANGVFAQSVGGSGGSGGDARVISVDLSADPMDFISLLDLMSLDTTIVIGGTGGTGGHGGDVTVANGDEETPGTIITGGAFSHGIVAQSVGGGGGSGGSAVTFEFSNTELPVEIPILDDISGLTTIEMTIQGNGGGGGDGGDVTLNSFGNVWTEGDFAMGAVAQSVAGGGGLAGVYNPHGISNNEIVNTIFNALIDTEAGISVAGSMGGAGDAGAVELNHFGNIETLGLGAHGLFAQSAAGTGAAGDVTVDLDGDIFTFGDHAYGIYAQSGGLGGNGNIDVTIHDNGTVMGGGGLGAGVFIAGGASNTLSNEGLITSAPGLFGYAIVGTGGNETVNNFGTLTGSVDLGFGDNAIFNDGMINSGLTYNLGGGYLVNAGHFAIGGIGNLFSTDFIGDFEQTEAGTLWYDLIFDYGADATDWLDISGSAALDGRLGLILEDTGKVLPGHHEHVLITSWGGFEGPNLSLAVPASAVIDYSLAVTNPTDYTLAYDIDFAPAGLTRNQAALGEHINEIQLAGGTSLMEPLTAEIVAIPDIDLLADAYDMLSPTIYSANQLSRLFASLDFEQSMHSCPVRDGDRRFSSEGSCNWMRVSDRNIEYEDEDGRLAATDYSLLVNMGLQRAISDRWHAGIAVGFENIDYEIPLAAERTGTQVQLGGILKGRYGNNAFDFSLTAGRGDYDTERYTSMPVEGEFTVGSRGLNYASAHAAYTYLFERERWYLHPSLDLGWIALSGDSFHETGSGPAALWVRHRDEEFFTSRAEITLGGEIRSDSATIYRPFARTAYTHILTGTTGEIHARLAGAPDEVGYFTQVLPFDDNFASLAVGLDVFTGEKWMLRLTYDRQYATSWDAESFFAKIIYGM